MATNHFRLTAADTIELDGILLFDNMEELSGWLTIINMQVNDHAKSEDLFLRAGVAVCGNSGGLKLVKLDDGSELSESDALWLIGARGVRVGSDGTLIIERHAVSDWITDRLSDSYSHDFDSYTSALTWADSVEIHGTKIYGYVADRKIFTGTSVVGVAAQYARWASVEAAMQRHY